MDFELPADDDERRRAVRVLGLPRDVDAQGGLSWRAAQQAAASTAR